MLHRHCCLAELKICTIICWVSVMVSVVSFTDLAKNRCFSTHSVVASYKPPMLVTWARFPVCAFLHRAGWLCLQARVEFRNMHTLGIEPRSQAWKACMMPLHYVCLMHGAPVQPHSLQQKSGLKRKTTECHPRRTATTSMSGTLRPPYQPTAMPSLLSALRGVLVLRNRFSISET